MKRAFVVVVLLGACASAKEDSTSSARPAHEVVSGAGRVRGGGVRMDVSIGHAFSQTPTKATGKALKQGTVTP